MSPYPFSSSGKPTDDDDIYDRRKWWRLVLKLKNWDATTATYIHRGKAKADEIAKKLRAVSIEEVPADKVPALCRYDENHRGASNGRKRWK